MFIWFWGYTLLFCKIIDGIQMSSKSIFVAIWNFSSWRNLLALNFCVIMWGCYFWGCLVIGRSVSAEAKSYPIINSVNIPTLSWDSSQKSNTTVTIYEHIQENQISFNTLPSSLLHINLCIWNLRKEKDFPKKT